MEPSVAERRKYKRFNVSFPIHFRLKTTNKYGNTLSCNISGGGIRMMLENFVPPKTDFMIEFTIVDFLQIISAVGRVVWTKKIPHSERYELGIEFKEIPPKNQMSINQFVINQLSKI
ncbi:MAG: PilZ domain-containing protein [Candidatus Omnitrophota bacterium]